MHGERRAIDPAEYGDLSLNTYEVLIVGGGPAGLSTAMGLAQRRLTTVIFDSQRYSLGENSQIQNVITWDQKDFGAFRNAALYDSLGKYDTNLYIQVKIVKAKKTTSATFELTDKLGNVWKGKKLVLACGTQYELPKFDGIAQCWARGIFPSVSWIPPEMELGISSGTIAADKETTADAMAARAFDGLMFTPRVTIYTNGNKDLAKKIAKLVGSRGSQLSIDTRVIKKSSMTTKGSNITLTFENTSEFKTEAFVTVYPAKRAIRGSFQLDLGLNLKESKSCRTIDVGQVQQTSVKGVFAVGDCAVDLTPTIANAIATGSWAAVCVARQIIAENLGLSMDY